MISKLKKISPLVMLMLLFTLSCGVKKNTTTPIFRHINLNFGERIELGDNFDDKEYLVNIIAESHFLKSTYFVGAESIEIILDDKKNVSKIIFQYNESTEKEKKIKSYTEDFGTPTLESGKAIWNDSKTQFEIYSLLLNDKEVIYSKLINMNKN